MVFRFYLFFYQEICRMKFPGHSHRKTTCRIHIRTANGFQTFILKKAFEFCKNITEISNDFLSCLHFLGIISQNSSIYWFPDSILLVLGLQIITITYTNNTTTWTKGKFFLSKLKGRFDFQKEWKYSKLHSFYPIICMCK